MTTPCTVQARWLEPATLALVMLIGVGFAIGAARADAAPDQSTTRTVSWYAENDRVRAQMQLKCIDDPGHLMNTPDCINAQQASIESAFRKMRGKFPPSDPSKPEFWSADPQNRRAKLVMCRSNTQLLYCDVARRSLVSEAGGR